MNLRQIFAKFDSLEEEHGHGQYKVNLDWSVEVLEEGQEEDQEEDQEEAEEQDPPRPDRSHGLIYPRSPTTGYGDEP